MINYSWNEGTQMWIWELLLTKTETLSSNLHFTIKHLENNLIYSHEKKVILKESGHERALFWKQLKGKSTVVKLTKNVWVDIKFTAIPKFRLLLDQEQERKCFIFRQFYHSEHCGNCLHPFILFEVVGCLIWFSILL